MPHNETFSPKPHPYRMPFGQIPLTKFHDYRKAINVKMLYAPDREKILPAVYDFVKATWSEDGKESERSSQEEMSEALSTMLSGKAMGLGIETIDFIFRIEGITRIDTHQIVRNRVGVTYSQQCTGDRFLTHGNVLIEECIAKNKDVLDSVISATLETKLAYAKMIDSLDVSIQTAREITPHNFETFIFMKINLMTLIQFYSKRIDDGSQTWPINIIAQQMADKVCSVYPELQKVFDKSKNSFKFQTEASKDRANTYSTSLYTPKNGDEFDYHDRDFLYQKTKIDMNFTNTPIDDMHYWGSTLISKEKYDIITKLYHELDILVDKEHYSNEKILELAKELNVKIINEII